MRIFVPMKWQQLISNKRLGQEERHAERHDDRSEFKRDYDRLIFSAPFRRLQNKTQVFPLPGSIFVHNRLTHSLEVASVGRSLGDDVAHELMRRHPELCDTLFPQIGTIVSAACLAHDLGNPPFGHSGEKAIQAYFTEGDGAGLQEKVSSAFWSDITHFEGNANAFRILTHRFKGRRDGGFVMIDIGDGHLGVYDAVKPIRHIWSKRLKRIAPGTYNLSISDGWIELYNRTMRGSYVIQMKDDDTKFFLKYVEQDIPVLVY